MELKPTAVPCVTVHVKTTAVVLGVNEFAFITKAVSETEPPVCNKLSRVPVPGTGAIAHE